MAEILTGGRGTAPAVPLGDRKFGGLTIIEEAAPRGMLMVRGNLADSSVAGAVHEVTKADIPGKLSMTQGEGGIVCWMSPDELLVIVPRERRGSAAQIMSDAL